MWRDPFSAALGKVEAPSHSPTNVGKVSPQAVTTILSQPSLKLSEGTLDEEAERAVRDTCVYSVCIV